MSTLAILLKESWARVEDRADDLANYFYARIFLGNPGLRDLFPVEMGAQRAHLLDALMTVIQTIDDPERFSDFLLHLGHAHRKFHVLPEHYPLIEAALLDALRRYAGERWSIEYDQAWRDAYGSIASTMINGTARDAGRPAYWHAEVSSHERRGGDVAVFTCRPLMPFTYQAGQYVGVECRYQPRLWRTYSPANAPRPDSSLEFHVRARGAGAVSSSLVRRLRAGDMIRLGPPMGSMTLDRLSTRDVVCVAGGTGLAPIRALVEEIARYNRTRWVHVFFGARTREELYDLPALTQLAGRCPWLSVVPACSADPRYQGEVGPINTVLERFGPWPDHDVFVSGPPAMVRATLGSLARMGVPPIRVRYDAVAAANPAARSWAHPRP